jgi:hypothetical protein
MSQNALPMTVTSGASASFNGLVERMCRGKRVRVQLRCVGDSSGDETECSVIEAVAGSGFVGSVN